MSFIRQSRRCGSSLAKVNVAFDVAIVLKGYPRLSETFISQEILSLQKMGLRFSLVSLRHPTDKKRHPINDEISAPVNYLPEYLYQEPFRVLRAWWRLRKTAGYQQAYQIWKKDLARDRTPNRVRRFGQALVLANELSSETSLIYAHFLHTPASVARYAAKVRGIQWSCSAHAKDIWTSPDWEKREKLEDMAWLVTCTSANVRHLKGLSDRASDKVSLLYHGLDFSRFPASERDYGQRDGSNPDDPVRLLSVGRAVEKKGYPVLLQALADLPESLNWNLVHIGGGALTKKLQNLATDMGVDDRIEWLGPRPQEEVLAEYRSADLFVLASLVAKDGDRDGLPNVLMEAQSQGLACLSTEVSAVPELIRHNKTGILVEADNPDELRIALEHLITEPRLRKRLGEAGQQRVRQEFGHDKNLKDLAKKFGLK